MTWAWVRPADPRILEGRPLLDIGTGDGQTLTALVAAGGLVVGLDRSPQALRAARQLRPAGLVCGAAQVLPFSAGMFMCVLAGDLFHHLDDAGLETVLSEIRRVLRPDGRLVAWWYEHEGREGPDAPRFPRSLTSGVEALRAAGFGGVEPIELTFGLTPAPPTVGVVAESDG